MIATAITGLIAATEADACTGIYLTAQDGSRVAARTVEWAATPMQCGYVVSPRGHEHQSFTPTGENGMKYTGVYGYVGIYTEYEPFIVEGVNETGLAAGLFFFPGYGEYAPYDKTADAKTICDMQFVSWVLSQFSTIDQVKDALSKVNLVTLDSKIGAVHWRIIEPNGRMVVLEIVAGVPHFYENTLGVLTNAPGFKWHMTNLNNYINMEPGSAPDQTIKAGITLQPLGHGSGMLGLPGDFTPPSRFVRATFFQLTAPQQPNAQQSVFQAFHILNNFDIPTGTELPWGEASADMPSATQFTVASDTHNRMIYYRTMYNSNIRCIDLKKIDFAKVKYHSRALDEIKNQPIEMITIR